ncbi:hypothetical protein [Sinorhizobium meliloti]
MITKTLEVTPQAVRRIVGELCYGKGRGGGPFGHGELFDRIVR